ncbi:uncharacterized protein LOC120186456 [Hibiscus syriacus]|uniref:uncharacterized protein LOC120186456 n=1 Tax=Hibiscus syriacus TaxID=106335 RepID=UPI0019228A40|nr:uncharacterized protein LOC120186456 [Hibiscus syriacus]
MHAPRRGHLVAVKRILRYLVGTLNHGLVITPSVVGLHVVAFADANWAGNTDDRKFISGNCVFVGENLVMWSSKKQKVVSGLTMEAEYRSVADVTAETTWISALLTDMGILQSKTSVIWCDNNSTVVVTVNPVNPVYHAKTEHVELNVHFVREKVAAQQVVVYYVPGSHQVADGLTNNLKCFEQRFVLFRAKKLSVTVFSQKSTIINLIQEIEPLDNSLFQKDVPPSTVDAMKRTISDMLGLLPSDRFQVLIETLQDPLSKLLVSSMMTGYTLRNAEYRLCLERNLCCDGQLGNQTSEKSNFHLQETLLDGTKTNGFPGKDDLSSESEKTAEDEFGDIEYQGMGDVSPVTHKYILLLRSRLTFMKKELREIKRKNAALQMQQTDGEEKNDLLDYLRSLEPYKVAELSEPTSLEAREAVYSVVHELLATLSPTMHYKVPPFSGNPATGALNNVVSEDCTELVENASLQLQPTILLTRDYLACVLFWCKLLGHYLRGLEYRMELIELLSSTSSPEDNGGRDEEVI